ncbi:MAG: LysR family transcriptional regulator [Trueperaceae bacterium]|nr:LysR family transcriptional regulator [Trueperaceae bacterium]
MTAEQLQAFCLAAKLRSLSKAAEALGSSQPAISRQLAALQTSMGRKLYERTPYGIELTPAGEALQPHACAVAQTLSQARQFVNHYQRLQPLHIKLGLSHSLVTSHTLRLLERAETLKERYQAFQLDLIEGYSALLIEQVVQRQIDGALILEPSERPPVPLISQRIGEDSICLLLPKDHPQAKENMISLWAITGETLILPTSLSVVRNRFMAYLERIQFKPKRLIEVSSPLAVKSVVMQGLGVGVSVRNYVDSEVSSGLLKRVDLEATGFTLGILQISHEFDTLEPAKQSALQQLFT